MLKRLEAVLFIAIMALAACRSSTQQAKGADVATDPAPPTLLTLIPADASWVAWVADVPQFIAGVSQYATQLLNGTDWALNHTQRDHWRASWGFDPLQPDTYRDVGIDVSAGAAVVMLSDSQDANSSPLLWLAVSDPNRFDAALDRIVRVHDQPAQRVVQQVGNTPVLSWIPAGKQSASLFRAYSDHFVIVAYALPPLQRWLNAPHDRPRLSADTHAMAMARHFAPGSVLVWSHGVGFERSESPWVVTSLAMDANGFRSENLIASPNDRTTPPPDVLNHLLQRVDPEAMAFLATVAVGTTGSFSKQALMSASPSVQTLLNTFTRYSASSFVNDVLPLTADGATASIRLAGSPGSLVPALSKLEAAASLDVRDGPAVEHLLDRMQAHLHTHPELGLSVERTALAVAGGNMQIYTLQSLGGQPAAQHPDNSAAPAPTKKSRVGMRSSPHRHGGALPRAATAWSLRGGVWHNVLVVATSDASLNRAVIYLNGEPSGWRDKAASPLMLQHLENSDAKVITIAALRCGRIAQILADYVRDTSTAGVPTLPVLNDFVVVLRRLDDIVLSRHLSEDGVVTILEQHFAGDRRQTP